MKTPPFLENLIAGERIIVPTSSAARALRRSCDDRQRQHGLSAWQPVDIFSWPQFLNHLWSQSVTSGLETRLLLNPAQEHSLWLDIIAARPRSASPDSIDRLAALCARAWSLACAYDCVKSIPRTANTPDTRAFAAWSAEFARLCDEEACLPSAELESALAVNVSRGKLPSISSLRLVGFADYTPAQQLLLHALREAGASTAEHSFCADATRKEMFAAQNTDEELRAIAQLIRLRLEAEPDARMGVLLPDAAEVPQVETVFREVLAPELEVVSADLSSAPWEVWEKGPLAAQTVVATAVHLLQFALTPQPLHAITGLLLSPYLGSAPDLAVAPRFDAYWLRQREMLRPEFDLGGLQRISQKSADAPGWIRKAAAYLASSNVTGQRFCADWSAVAQGILRAAEWPGPRSLTSLEYQATEAFGALLDTLATLDFRGRRVPFADFIGALARLASTTPFAPASTSAPVQVLSPSAAVAQRFDMLIVARATEENYPAREQANPLLSFPLQASLEMPGAHTGASARRTARMWSQLLAASDETVFSYSLVTANGPQRFSPLLESLASPQPIDVHSAPPAEQVIAECFTDASPLPPLPSDEVAGGARVLKLQAACGFLAFAELRLRATQIDAPITGLDPVQSGSFLHRTLERFWQNAQSQETLRNYSPEQLRDALQTAIAETASSIVTVTEWDRAFMRVQQERMLQVLSSWMQTELERSPFTVIACEKKEHITVGPLTLSVRMDRIDQVEGGHVFVDYKTGSNVATGQWEGDRPDEPQLPLYALFSEPGELKGMAFARVIAGNDNKWAGYQAEAGILSAKGIRDIDSDIEQWRSTLTTLAENFAAGVVDVNPKSFAVNCAHCGQRLLCRINPEAFLHQAETGVEEASQREAAE